jgi:hypothetical protein
MMLLTPVTKWEPHGVTLAGYRFATKHGMKVQIVIPYRVSNLQRYGVKVRGIVTSVYPTLRFAQISALRTLACLASTVPYIRKYSFRDFSQSHPVTKTVVI